MNSKCLHNGCGFWCWLHDRLPCMGRWALLCWLADRTHYPELRWEDYR